MIQIHKFSFAQVPREECIDVPRQVPKQVIEAFRFDFVNQTSNKNQSNLNQI